MLTSNQRGRGQEPVTVLGRMRLAVAVNMGRAYIHFEFMARRWTVRLALVVLLALVLALPALAQRGRRFGFGFMPASAPSSTTAGSPSSVSGTRAIPAGRSTIPTWSRT